MIITFTAKKGGVTKTTSSAHTAYALTSPGEKTGDAVLLVDTDPQSQCSSILGLEPGPGLFTYFMADGYTTSLELAKCIAITASAEVPQRRRLLLLPGSQKTVALVGALKAQLDARQLRLEEIAERFRALAGQVNHVVIDTPASGILQEAAVMAADLVIVPTGLERLDLEGVPATLGMVQALAPGKTVGILPSLMDARIGDHKANLKLLQTQYPGLVFDPIHRRAAVGDATSRGRLIFETDPACVVAGEYEAVARRLLGWRCEPIQGEL